jgi:hypothetical protein
VLSRRMHTQMLPLCAAVGCCSCREDIACAQADLTGEYGMKHAYNMDVHWSKVSGRAVRRSPAADILNMLRLCHQRLLSHDAA